MPILTLNQALDDYYNVVRGRYEAKTWATRQSRLEDFRRWIITETQPNVYITDICERDARYMERYFNRIRPPALKPSSWNAYRSIVSAFWVYAQARGFVQLNPMLHIDPVKVPQRRRLQLSATELLQMLEDATPRDRVGLAVGMNTALRASDIANLDVGSADLNANWLSVYIKKTKKFEEMPITIELRAELLRWFAHYAEAMNVASISALPNSWPLMPAARWQPFFPLERSRGGQLVYLTSTRLTRPHLIVHRALERLGHPILGEGFHTLRRSGARVVYEQAKRDGEADPMSLPQAFLGHEKRSTTEHYLGTTVEKERRDTMLRGRSLLGRAAEADAAANAAADGGAEETTTLRRVS